LKRWTQRSLLAAAFTVLALAEVRAQSSLVIVTGAEASMPIPTLMEGDQGALANYEISDHLFLRLATLGPTLTTGGDAGFVPQLARSWTRRDSVTLAFELDPRARWHDGTPVTSRDVVFTMMRARDSTIAPRVAKLLRYIQSVEAEGDRTVVFRFTRVYSEQLYDATFHTAMLPAHLLAGLPPHSLARSAYASHPIGNGPYRWVRRVPGQLIELAANQQFFLGRPSIQKLIVRVARDPDARLNMVLSGEADAMDNLTSPTVNAARVAARPELRLVMVPAPSLGYLLYNQRANGDSTRPHPILSDLDVRRALTLSLDRPVLVKAVLGGFGEVPYGPTSTLLWIRHGTPTPLAQDRAAAQRLLESRGWVDRDGDGVRERDGKRLVLQMIMPNTSAIRGQMSLLIQQQFRQVGVMLELMQLDGPTWGERREAGKFDIDFSGAIQDPSPSGLVQSWSCSGSSNVAEYCDPAVDSLLDRAILAPDDARSTWQEILRRIEADAPATFLYRQTYAFVVNRRFSDVVIRPESSWSLVWRWKVGPAPTAGAVGY
jgi:peptide/nickel transport system substrate-binding protein